MTEKKKRYDPLAIVSEIAKQEKELQGQTFLAPYVGGGKVRLRLDGIVYEMSINSCPEGFGIMQVLAPGKAAFVKSAPLSMVKAYLALFPRIRLVLVDKFDGTWWALEAGAAQKRIQLNGPVPVMLADSRAASFETANCRFDGGHFWFENIDSRRDASMARHLRKSLADETDPEKLQCKGMVPSEKLAYKMLWLEKMKDKPEVLDDATRITRALQHSGARLDRFWFQNGSEKEVSIRFSVGNRMHVVQINKDDLSVISAGICLSGRDSDFDLSSLVGVLREAENEYYYD